MIIIWLKAALLFAIKLILPPPPQAVFPVIDRDEQCPACGHRNGGIECVAEQNRTVVQHTCNECGAQWNVATVLKTDKIRPKRK